MDEKIIILRAFIIFSIVAAIWCCMLSGMILGFIGDWLHKNEAPDWVRKPICECLVCMMPYYGFPFYWVMFGGTWQYLAAVLLVAMGMATVFVKIKRN